MRNCLVALIAGLVVLVSGVAHAEKKIALVIGNDRYANLPVLQKAVNDAEAVGNTLARLGFEVIRGRDLGRQGMIDRLAEFTARLEAGDTAFFFYAGHGVAIGGVNYLLPSDVPDAAAGAEARVRGASIAEGDVIAEIQAKGARVAVLVIDACRNNPFPRVGGRSIGSTRGLAEAKPARGVFTIYSAGIGQEALDGLEPNDASPNSVFTRVFVEQLGRPGLHIGELAVEVREKVAEIARKARNSRGDPAPHEQTPAYYDQTVGGRVFLAGRAITIEPSSPTPPLPAPPTPADPDITVRRDYEFAERAGTKEAWDAFLARHPSGYYADLARAQRAKLAAVVPLVRPPALPAPDRIRAHIVAAELMAEGAKFEIGTDRAGYPKISVVVDGFQWTISFFDCDQTIDSAQRTCESLQLSSTYLLEKPPPLTVLNQWHVENRYVRVYYDVSGGKNRAHLNLDVLFAGTGSDPASRFRRYFDVMKRLAVEFRETIKYRN